MGINIKDFLESLELPDGGSYRSDCPVCSGHNSFTATNEDSFLKYNCYKLSCDLGGAVPINLTAEEIILKLVMFVSFSHTFVLLMNQYMFPIHPEKEFPLSIYI